MATVSYTRLFEALDSAGLRSRTDIIALREKTASSTYRVPGVMDNAGSWVSDVFSAAWDLQIPVLNLYMNQPSPRLMAGRIQSYCYYSSKVCDDPVISRRAAYAMLFPQRTLFLSFPLVAWPDEGMEDIQCPVGRMSSAKDVLAWGRPFIPYDYLAQAIELRPLLERGMAYLLSQRFTTESYGDNCEIKDGWWTAKDHTDIDVASIDKSTVYSFQPDTIDRMPDLHEFQVLALPWLHGSSIRISAELIEECQNEYDQYMKCFGHYFATHDFSDATLKNWIQEMQYNVERLHIRYKEKEKELRRHGFDVFAGLCFTAAPLLMPQVFGPLSNFLAAAFGGSTIKDGLAWLSDWNQREKSIADSEYWFMWKLARQQPNVTWSVP